jgi:hypothetical protein
MAAKKSASRQRTSAKGQAKAHQVMREYKHGQLKSGGKKKVRSRKQAVAIALSEARRSGAKVAPPPKRSASAKKSSTKRSGAKKSSNKKG